MSRLRRGRLTAGLIGLMLGLAAAALSPPPRAFAAGAYQQVLGVYERSGTVPPCRFSAGELQRALSGVDTYGAQYFADFTQAIQAALTAAAGGQCSPAASPRPRIPSSPALAREVARLPAVTAATSAAVPAPMVALGVIALLGAGGGGVSLLMRSARDRHRHRAAGDDPARGTPDDPDRS